MIAKSKVTYVCIQLQDAVTTGKKVTNNILGSNTSVPGPA